MGKVTIQESTLTSIADAIRAKGDTTAELSPSDMPTAIAAIPDPSTLSSAIIVENGVHTPPSGVDGFSQVTAAVPNSYEASDEGKVVSSSALVSQTSTSITVNGTYDTTTNDEAVVNVTNTYTAEDEGKVVSSSALVSQTSTTISANGTYDTTLNNEVVVSVSASELPSASGTSF